MKTRILLFVMMTVCSLASAEEGETITTTDGRTYTNAKLTELRPNGAVVSSDSGVATVPYSNLPKALRERYAFDTDEVAKQLKAGIDGIYKVREDVGALAGEVLELKAGEFTYSTFSDVVVAGEDRQPLRGRFQVSGSWLILQRSTVKASLWVITMIDGRVALLLPAEYKHWKDAGVVGRPDALYRRERK